MPRVFALAQQDASKLVRFLRPLLRPVPQSSGRQRLRSDHVLAGRVAVLRRILQPARLCSAKAKEKTRQTPRQLAHDPVLIMSELAPS